MTVADWIAGIATSVSEHVGAGYWAAVALSDDGPTFDDGGSIVSPGVLIERDCMAQVDKVTEEMRSNPAFTADSVRLLVLTGSLSGALDTDCRIRVEAGPHAGTYTLATCQLDPAATHWVFMGRRDG